MRSILKVISLQECHSTMLAFNVSESQPIQNETVSSSGHDLSEFVPKEVLPLRNPQTDIPRIAKDEGLLRLIEEAVQRIPTRHELRLGDARTMDELAPESVHLVLTSPPYWTPGTLSFRFMPRSKSIAGASATTTWRRSSGTRSRMLPTRWRTGRASSASRTSPTP
jgi:hypothetical protein